MSCSNLSEFRQGSGLIRKEYPAIIVGKLSRGQAMPDAPSPSTGSAEATPTPSEDYLEEAKEIMEEMRAALEEMNRLDARKGWPPVKIF